jgi:hypothetical protein
MTKVTFTAHSAKQLSKQIDAAEAVIPDLSINFGREGNRGTWFIHGAYGSQLKTGLSFHSLVSEAQKRADCASESIDF